MSKPLLGIVLGGVLGLFDGLTALVSAPEVAPQIVGIMIGSTFKGIIVGGLAGWYSPKRVRSLTSGTDLRPRRRRVFRLPRGRHARSVGEALLLGNHAARQHRRAAGRLRDAALGRGVHPDGVTRP